MKLDAVQREYATRPVPRYTSYPAVPHFSSEFSAATYRDWLERIPEDEPISLYLHVPFCRELCWYCGCNMRLVSRYEPVSEYVELLAREIDLLGAVLPHNLRISHLHWGGGTPTALQPDDLERLMDRLRQLFAFSPEAELAIESDPRTLTPEMSVRIGELGFTRASFGVQEFDPKVQAAINRVQSQAMVRGAIEGLRESGVAGINVDLIYGLPHQTTASLARTVSACAQMQPDRLALFGYAHVPWMAKKQRLIDESALPDPDARAEQANTACEKLVDAGYQAIGLDHFARPGDALAKAAGDRTLRRNFQGYTVDTARTLLGCGVTSIGKTPFGFAQNLGTSGRWSEAISAGEFPVMRGHTLSDEDRARSEVIESLMCFGDASLASVGESWGLPNDWWLDALDELQPMQDDELVELDQGGLRLTERGRPLVRVVVAAFDQYRRAAPARHSVAL